ncbi:MAG: type II toxin-antitoxin system RelE/ParE family toxin [Verrucomicrobia bacterium]|nr:type II toxin-antitoxin system RelE/ParE family toxin [Prolixibacteraceae bacterium]
MKSEFKASFLKAIKKIESNKLKAEITDTILNVESADSIRQIHNLKKLKGFKQYYRIKIGDYRIGIKLEEDTVYFVDIDHRKNIYRIFPK